jgi:hypothetical protein
MSTVFWTVIPCCSETAAAAEGMFSLLHASAGFLFVFLFNPADGGNMFF